MEVKITVLWSFILLQLVVSERCGDGYCKCSKARKVATCMSRRRQLNYFPSLPTYVKQLRYSGNYLPHLTRDLMINLTRVNLEQLYLEDNVMFKVDPDAFENLTNLLKLQISHDKILNASIVHKFSIM